MENVELLAPAGSLDILKAAIFSGADAVYIGGKNFGARAFANNFDHAEIIEAVKFAHHYGVRIYVTMNTLLNEYELEAAMKEVDFLYKSNVDALIIQDLGLYYRIINTYPDFEIHASTQLHIHNISGVKTCEKLGFKRVVLARESSLALIEEACKEDIEIEIFVHGAICVSYSGQCLMSSKMLNRSGNKGVCAQCCRLPYEIYDEDGKQVNNKDKYVLSPKDMNLLVHIPSLIKAGVRSFKIEGRMKKKAYVCNVTSLYRQAIDAYYHNEKFIFTDKMDYELHVLFQRDFTDSYLLDDNDNKNFFSSSRPNHLGVNIGRVVKIDRDDVYIKLTHELHQFDGIRFLNKNDDGLIINYLYLNDLLVSKANKNDIVKIKCDFKVKVNDEVIKTSDYLLEKSYDKLNNIQRLGLEVKVVAKINSPLAISFSLNDIKVEAKSDVRLERAQKLKSAKEDIYKQINKLKDSPYFIKEISYQLDDVFIPNKLINELRRNLVIKLDEKRASGFKRNKSITNYSLLEISEALNGPLAQYGSYICHQDDKYLVYNVINTSSIYPLSNYAVVSELGALFNDADHKIAYYTLNTSNSYAYELLRKLGYEAIILSSELNLEQTNTLYEAYLRRNNDKAVPYYFKRGHRVLMYLKKDPMYMLEKSKGYIQSGKDSLLVKRDDDKTLVIEEDYRRDGFDDYNSFEFLDDKQS